MPVSEITQEDRKIGVINRPKHYLSYEIFLCADGKHFKYRWESQGRTPCHVHRIADIGGFSDFFEKDFKKLLELDADPSISPNSRIA